MKTLRNITFLLAFFFMAIESDTIAGTIIIGALIIALLLISVYANHKTEEKI